MKKQGLIFIVSFCLISLKSIQIYSTETGTRNLALNRTAYHSSAKNFVNVGHMVTDGNSTITRWESKTRSSRICPPEWVYVDLGKVCLISRVVLKWEHAYAVHYKIEISTDSRRPQNWTSVYSTIYGDGDIDDIFFEPVNARYVRMYATKKSTGIQYSLWEFEVYGKGNFKRASIPNSPQLPDGRLYLDSNWKLQNAAFVKEKGEQISTVNYKDSTWLIATVPGTVLSTYIDNEAVPDPNYGNQQLMVSEFITTSKFWYRTEVVVPSNYDGKKIWLNFNGVNHLAEVFINGTYIQNVKRCFLRKKIDITDIVKSGQKNSIAVLIHPVEHPGDLDVQCLDDDGYNGGKLGLDSPNFLFSVGIDCCPTIRGRCIGIWDDVYLSQSGPVLIFDPFIAAELPLPDTSFADMTIKLELKNTTDKIQKGILKGKIDKIAFEKNIYLKAFEKKTIIFNKERYPQLRIKNPELWWPNGYGKQKLYNLNFTFETDNGEMSDIKNSHFGIRQYSYEYPNGANLQIYVNGIPIMCRGGNWGTNECNIRADKKMYKTRIRLHKEMNFNMIRNWAGQTGHEVFYDYCDEYGIMVWDEFWLLNGNDGPNPADTVLFRENAEDKIKKLRNHPCIALWCGRNETEPPPGLDKSISNAVNSLDGTRLYIDNSRAYPINNDSGPWSLQESPAWYFNFANGVHTELGIPCVPPVESMREMMPEEFLWPINDVWGMHDYTRPGAAKSQRYTDAVNQRYGAPTGIDDFCRKAQMINLANYKALFEGWGNIVGEGNCGGVLLWMSQSVWPSLIWQTYDYYFEPTGAYFGSKKACEPIHIQWDASNNQIKAVNITSKDLKGLTAEGWLYNLDGTKKFYISKKIDIPSYSNVFCFFIPDPKTSKLSSVHFIKLKLRKGDKLLSDNFYWRGKIENNYQDLSKLPHVNLLCSAKKKIAVERVFIKMLIKNNASNIAFMSRLKVLNEITGKRILPVFYSDNYFSLLPGESKNINIEFATENLNNANPKLMIEGWNIISKEVSIH